MRTEEPRSIRLADYKAPDFRIVTVHLDFALAPQATRVTARLDVERHNGNGPLVLQGECQKLLSVALDGKPLSGCRLDDKSLTIADVPQRFTLEIVSEIDPSANTALEGLFLSNGMFCTQCEPEGFPPHHLFPGPARQSVGLHRADGSRRASSIRCCFPTATASIMATLKMAAAFCGVERSLPQAVLSVRAGGGRSGQHHMTASPP